MREQQMRVTLRNRSNTNGWRIVALAVCLLVGPAWADGKTAAMTALADKSLAPASIEMAPHVGATVGKSLLLHLRSPATRVSVGNPAVADVMLLSATEIYLLGKSVGTTNLMVWSRSAPVSVVDINVGVDAEALQSQLRVMLPDEKGIRVEAVADSLALTGVVADAAHVDRAMGLATAYAGKKVINLLQVAAPQQVLLEVKVAEVSKTLIDKLGAQYNAQRFGPSWSPSVLSSFLIPGLGGNLSLFHDANNSVSIDAERDNNLVKILAEPNIMAMSGQEGSFLAGGMIFIPVPQGGIGGVTITLEEKQFGVGLKFTPTVLEGGLINLRVSPEVSELSTTGTTITAAGVTSVLPTITTRRASTTVQLRDGESFAIGGLIKNNLTQNVNALPALGELPVLGALFRSSGFQNDRTELMFVITPHLVKPLPTDYRLPTDSFVEPTRTEFFLKGKMEGQAPAPAPAPAATQPAQPAGGASTATPAPVSSGVTPASAPAGQPLPPVTPANAHDQAGGFETK